MWSSVFPYHSVICLVFLGGQSAIHTCSNTLELPTMYISYHTRVRTRVSITVTLMMTGAFSGNIGKLFSDFKLVTDNFSSFMQKPTEKPLKEFLAVLTSEAALVVSLLAACYYTSILAKLYVTL